MRLDPSLMLMVFLVGCTAISSGPSTGSSIQGCWVGPASWTDSLHLRFVLDSTGGGGEVEASPRPSSLRPDSWIWLDGTDSIQVQLGQGGFVGETIRAQVRSDRLEGTTQPHTDEGGANPPPRHFVAERIQCGPDGSGS